MFEFLDIQKKGRICILTINNPQQLNCLNVSILKELDDFFTKISIDETTDVVIVTGAGKAFVAGADVKEMCNLTVFEAETFSKFGVQVFRKIETLEKVVIAGINGYALGGGNELALACDLRIASVDAKFGQPEVCLGIIPGFSGTQRLSRIVGIGNAKELVFTGKTISAEEAYRIGLVNKLVPPNELLNTCMEIAEQITKNSSMAVKYAKQSINTGIDTNIDSGIFMESVFFSLCFSSEEQKNRMTKFLEKKHPTRING